MKPILFSENSTTFNSNGIGRLADAISCVVTEERNGMYELEMEYPIDGQHFSDIDIRSIIAVVPFDGGTIQAFRVYQISKPISGRVMINAQHISYDLSKNTCMPFAVAAAPTACASVLAKLKSNAVEACPFTFWTDVTTAGSYNQTVPASIKARLGGVEGSVLDQFGGEYEWDNFTVKLHRQRGTLAVNNGITLRYGKNITDITQEENIADTATGVVPYWADTDGNIVTLPEKAVYSPHAGNYSQKLTVPLDMSGDFEDQPTVAALRTAAQVVANSSDFGVPKVSIEVSFVALWTTEEYKNIAPLQRVKLCDEVTVSFEKLGVDATAKVVKTEYDVLAERYRSVSIGSIRSNLATTLNDQTAQTLRAIEAQSVATSQAINNATKWLTSAGGYVIAIKNTDGTWKELIFSNMTDPYNSSAKILRINNNGIGFSTTGMNGTFTNAWTIDGHLVADFIFGGTLTLGGKSGTTDNNRGWLKILNSSNVETGRWDMNGIQVKAGTIKLGNKAAIGDANDGVYIGSDGLALGKNSTFKVTNAGALTASSADVTGAIKATSGEIGSGSNKFTITGNHIANGKGSLTDANDGVYVGTDGIALGKSSKFKVTNDGTLNATGATINGRMTTTSSGNTTTIGDGRIDISMASGNRNSIHISRGDNEMSIGPVDVTWMDNDVYLQADWSDILEIADHKAAIRKVVRDSGGEW